MVGPYGYCADISRAFVVGNKFNDEQKKIYSMAVEQIEYNSNLINQAFHLKSLLKNHGNYQMKSWK